MREDVQAKIAEGVADGDQVRFSFKLNSDEYKQLEWTEDDEFRLKGMMYDVIEMQVKDGYVNIRCYQDNIEAELMAYLDALVDANLGKLGQGAKKLLDYIKIIFIACAEETLFNIYSSLQYSQQFFKIFRQVRLLPAHLMSVYLPPEV